MVKSHLIMLVCAATSRLSFNIRFPTGDSKARRTSRLRRTDGIFTKGSRLRGVGITVTAFPKEYCGSRLLLRAVTRYLLLAPFGSFLSCRNAYTVVAGGSWYVVLYASRTVKSDV